MTWQFQLYLIILIIGIGLALVVAAMAWRRRDVVGAVSMTGLGLAVAWWQLMGALEVMAADLPTKILCSQLQYLGIATVPVLWFLFSLDYSGVRRRLSHRTVRLLWLIPAFTILVAFTQGWHTWLWSRVTLQANGAAHYEYGWWFLVHAVYSYALIVGGIILLIRTAWQLSHAQWRPILLVAAASLFPLTLNILYLAKWGPIPDLDLTAVGFAIAGLVMVWNVFGFHLFDLSPVARDLLVESMDDGVIVLDRDNHIVDINPAGQRLIGATESTIGMPAQQVFAAWPDLVERYRNVEQVHSEIRVDSVDSNRPAYVELRISPLRNRRNRLVGRLITLHDVTDHRQAELRLRQLSRAVEQSPASIMITDLEGRIQYVNPKFTELTGYESHEVIGRYSNLLKSGETSPEEYALLWQTIQSGSEWRGEFHNKKKNGELYWESAIISPISDAQGQLTHYLAVKEDITERKQAEAIERRRLQESEALRATMTEVLGELELSRLLRALIERVVNLLDADEGELASFTPSANELTILVSYRQALDYRGLRMKLGEGAVGQVALSRQPLIIADYGSWEGRSVHFIPESHPLTLLLEPLSRGDDLLGVIAVGADNRRRTFGDQDLRLMGMFAQQAAIAIHNARLFEELRQRAQRQDLINDISMDIISLSGNTQEVMQSAIDGLTSVLRIDQIGVALFTGDRRRLIVQADHPAPENQSAVGLEVPLQGNLSMQRVLETRRPVMIVDAQHDPLLSSVQALMMRQHVQSILIVPLIVRDEVIGTIGFDALRAPRVFTQEEIDLGQTVANLIALRIEQARLFEGERAARQEAQRHMQDLGGLYAVTRATSRSLVVEDVVVQALTAALASLQFEAGVIALVDGSPASLNISAERGLTTETRAQLFDGANQNSLLAYTYRQREVVLIDSQRFHGTRTLQPLALQLGQLGWQTTVGIPLLHRDQPLGVMCILTRQARPASPIDMALFASMGHQVAAAISNAQLFQSTLNERSRLKALIEASRDGIILCSVDGTILVMNPPALALLRLSGTPAEWVNRPIGDAIREMRRGAPQAALATIHEMRRLQTEAEPTAEGDYEVDARPIHWQSLPVKVGARSMGRLIVVRDMTEERAVEQMREDMTHTMVHDLRNPLTSIFSAVSMVLDGTMGKPTVPQQKVLEIARGSTERMMKLVGAILDVSRLESGRMPVTLIDVNVTRLIQEALQAQAALAHEKHLRLEQHLPAALPKAQADLSLIQRVMQNLLGNAIKFTPDEGCVAVTVRVGEARDGSPILLISISDTGPGIPPEIQSRLFQKFVTGGQHEHGSGLGLAFCKLAVEAHGQRIWVDSTLGHGTTFTFTLAAVP